MTLIQKLFTVAFAVALLFGVGFAIGYVANKAMVQKGVSKDARQLTGVGLLAALGIVMVFVFIGGVGLFGVFSNRESIIILIGLAYGGWEGWNAADE